MVDLADLISLGLQWVHPCLSFLGLEGDSFVSDNATKRALEKPGAA